MNIFPFKILAVLALAATMGLAAPAMAQGQCLESAAEIQAMVSSGEVMSPYDALASGGYNLGPEDTVLNYRLCDEGGRWVYTIGVLIGGSDAQNLVLSAQ